MSGIFSDFWGTSKAYFKIGGTAGVRLKNSSGNLLVRDTGDTADAAVTVSQLNNSGDSIVINSDAAGSGADWSYTIQRPTSGMTANQTLKLPAGLGSAGQAVVTDGAGNWSYASAGDTSLCSKMDSTALAYGTSSPAAMFSTGANDIIDHIDVTIDTPFNGTATMSIGVSGTASKYMGSTDVDLTAAAGTTFQVHPGLSAQGAESLILTYAAGGSTAGAARAIVFYGTPA